MKLYLSQIYSSYLLEEASPSLLIGSCRICHIRSEFVIYMSCRFEVRRILDINVNLDIIFQKVVLKFILQTFSDYD